MAPSVPVASKASFAAVADSQTRVLLLGSLPGEISLARAEYYAHPRNQFWRLMQTVIETPLDGLPYRTRLATLLAAGVGLWDVIQSAERVGSLDANIRDHRPNTLAAFAATLPALRAIGFNGGKAWEIGRKALGADGGYELIALPSSSPAHTMAFERKQAAWARLGAFLGPMN
jgi:double-stranded uracil-DNA glycosylase